MFSVIMRWGWKCAKMPCVILFSVANIILVALIFGEYTINTVPVATSLSEHPGGLVNLTVFLNTTPVAPDRPDHQPLGSPLLTMPRLNTTDPGTNRTVIVEIFNPRAYFNVDVGYLNGLAQKALHVNAANCDGLTMKSAKTRANQSGLPLCSCEPDTLEGRAYLDLSPPSLEEMSRELPGLEAGGHWAPRHCISRQRIAIIVPYKDREVHLRVFLYHYHRMLQRQQIEYRIFVAEQAHPDIFNKGSIMNTGFTIASQYYDFDCVIFHDIDLLAEDDRQLYLCTEEPRHLTPRNDRSNYTKPYGDLVGGGISMWKETFREINGYTNMFYGWGGEDDNLAARMKKHKHRIFRYPASISRYAMLKHDRKGKTFPYNNMVYRQMKENSRVMATEGLNSLKYTIHDVKNLTLYTWIYAEWDSDVSHFTDTPGWCSSGHYRMGKRVTINKCASKCLGEKQCRAFSYVFSKATACYLYAKECTPVPHSDYNSHTFRRKHTTLAAK